MAIAGAIVATGGGILAGLGVGGGDRVAVLNSSFQQVFPNARPVNADVKEDSSLFDHPIETGQLITDYAIILPTEITLDLIVEQPYYRATYQLIKGLYVTKQLLIVQTNADNYPNMVIVSMPHRERPEFFDGLPITLRFRQVQLVPDPSTFVPADPTQVDTQNLGQQSGYSISGVQTSIGTQTIPMTAYSSVPSPGTISGVQTLNGPQTIPLETNESIPVTGVQTLTSGVSIGSAFQ